MRVAALVLATAALSAAPQAGQGATPTGFITTVLVGLTDPAGKVPVIDGVPGAGVSNWGVAYPLGQLTAGNFYTYSVTMQDLSYTGKCTASYDITQVINTKKTVIQSAKIASFACKPNTVWAWAINAPALPSSPGPATLTGIATFGTRKAVLNIPIVLQ
jgi:hypothetical protein